jgi:membrane-associated protease RseP (regulator of RpoE activity)
MTFFVELLLPSVVILLSILAHELGHWLVAAVNRVKVTEFYFMACDERAETIRYSTYFLGIKWYVGLQFPNSSVTLRNKDWYRLTHRTQCILLAAGSVAGLLFIAACAYFLPWYLYPALSFGVWIHLRQLVENYPGNDGYHIRQIRSLSPGTLYPPLEPAPADAA